MITFQGDAHGKLRKLAKPGNLVVQVGDLGIGFVSPVMVSERVTKRTDFKFIRGNHDFPDACRLNPNYLGEFGTAHGFFFVSGAWSIDQSYRMEGRDWWRDEELSTSQMREAFDLYTNEKPRIMVTHEGPSSLFVEGGPMALRDYRTNATATLLQAMFEYHQPELWIFGHHHVSRDFRLNGTRFRCLEELETFTPPPASEG